MQTAHLEKWSVTSIFGRSPCLSGVVTSHPKCGEGHLVFTSDLKKLSIKEKTAETRNTIYSLGEMDPVFKKYLEDNNLDKDGYDKYDWRVNAHS